MSGGEVDWVLRDSSERPLYVHTLDADGTVAVGITNVYRKDLTPRQARRLARKLLRAADRAEVAIGRVAKARAAAGPVSSTSGASVVAPASLVRPNPAASASPRWRMGLGEPPCPG